MQPCTFKGKPAKIIGRYQNLYIVKCNNFIHYLLKDEINITK